MIPAALGQTYPSRSARLLVPFAPGGATDILGRLIAAELTGALGQSFVVENISGGGGNIGSTVAARAAADGYTLLFGAAGNIAINPHLFKMPYDPIEDLAPVALVASTMNVLVVHPSLPVTTVRELIDLARSKPDELSYASAGIGSTIHLAAEMFKEMAGVKIVPVHYRGSAPAMVDLLAGRTQLMFENMPSALPRIKAGALRAIGVTARTRSPDLPDVPTIDEAGLPGFEAISWFGVFVPARTPAAIVEQLLATISKVVAKPEVVERIHALGAEPTLMGPEAFGRLVRSDTDKWGTIIRSAGIKAD